MSSQLNRQAYEQLIKEDLAWLRSLPDTLENHHVQHIVADSVKSYYDKGAAATKLRAAFDTLLIHEVNYYGGIPHLSNEQQALREVIAELLELFPEETIGA